MTESHHALIVEDDPNTAEDLEEILKSLSCSSTVVNNRQDALELLGERAFCFVLLDLEIKLERDSIKGHVEHGLSLLREARKTHSERTSHWMPIVIVSGFARERDAAVGAMKQGADDVVQKPLKSGEVSKAVRDALAASGRTTHAICQTLVAARPASKAAGDAVVLSIPGDRHGRRTRVLVGSSAVDLPDSALTLLLHLIVAHLTNESVHKQDLAGGDVHGFKGVSRLREHLKPFLAEGVDIIKNDYQGHYRLDDDVAIGACDTRKLIDIGDAKITKLARGLEKCREKKV